MQRLLVKLYSPARISHVRIGSTKIVQRSAFSSEITNLACNSQSLLEVLDAVGEVFGLNRVGIRLSPLGTFNDMRDSDPVGIFSHVLRALAKRSIAYVHLIEARGDERALDEGLPLDSGAAPTAALFRPFYPSVLIGAGGFTRESADEAIAAGTVDAVAFGRLFISNPDLPLRLKLDAELNSYDRTTFYGGAAQGYTDYATLEDLRASESQVSELRAGD